MSGDMPAEAAPDLPPSRQQRERQLIEWMRDDPTQVYAAYLRVFGSGTPDAPTLTPLAMVRTLLEHEYPHGGED
jgi:hypothetical protein